MAGVNVEDQVRQVLESVLNVKGLIGAQGRETPLLGSVPELDWRTNAHRRTFVAHSPSREP